jgi:hypothetical protein
VSSLHPKFGVAKWMSEHPIQTNLNSDNHPLSTVFRRRNHMTWFYWNTAWSLFFSLVWFMTITHNPDAQIADAHLRDEAFGG